MSITNYGTLKTAIANWINRSDLGSYLPDFVTMAEQMIYFGYHHPQFQVEPVRCMEMQTTETPTVTGGAFTLNSMWLETIRLSAVSGATQWELEYMPPADFNRYELLASTPAFYTIMNNTIKVGGTDSYTIRHDYYQRSAPMSADADTTTLLVKSPSLYLQAGLFQAAIFTRDDALMQTSYANYVASARSVNGISRNRPGPLYVRAA